MKHRWSSVSILLLLTAFSSFGQTNDSPRHFVSVQPVLGLDNLLPQSYTGIGAQYEYAITHEYGLTFHALWFWGPFNVFRQGYGSKGGAVSGEVRYYFSGGSRGWHIGPFAEWSLFKYSNYYEPYYGSKLNHVFGFGGLAGYKWVRGSLTFDISARTAWFNQRWNVNNFYPWASEFRSHLLISIGYAIG